MKGLHHVGVTVKDLDASIRFYHDVLGLQFSNEPSPWFEGEGLETGRRGSRRRSEAGKPAARRHDARAPGIQEPAERNPRADHSRTASVPPTSPSRSTTSTRRRPSSKPRASSSTATSTWSTKVCSPAGAGCTSRIRTATRSSSSRSRTTTQTSGERGSRSISRRGSRAWVSVPPLLRNDWNQNAGKPAPAPSLSRHCHRGPVPHGCVM